MKIFEIKMPSDGMQGVKTHTKIIKWYVENNQEVSLNEYLLKVENKHYELEIPADFSGKVLIKKQKDEQVKVGDVLCTIEVEDSE